MVSFEGRNMSEQLCEWDQAIHGTGIVTFTPLMNM